MDGTPNEPEWHDRLRLAVWLLRTTTKSVAKHLGISTTHLRLVARGQRKPSRRLLDAMEKLLGSAAFAFVMGRANKLRDPGTTIEIPARRRGRSP